MIDPNPLVGGKGIEKCKNAGIEVEIGVLENECKKLNEIFIKNITEQKPFIAIKSAITLDGKIATATGSSKWITGAKAREKVHELRNNYDAVLTGSGTIIADNPSLDCRIQNGKNPIKIVVDSSLKTSPEAKVYRGEKSYIATFKEATPYNAELIIFEKKANKINLDDLVQKLYNNGIRSILIEAGGVLNGEFVKQNLVDKLYLFVAPKILGDKNAKNFIEGFNPLNINECKNLSIGEIKNYSPDIMIEAYF